MGKPIFIDDLKKKFEFKKRRFSKADINHYRLFNAKSSLSIYMIWLGSVKLSWFLWHINHYRLFDAKSSLYIYIKIYMICLGWVLWHINDCRLFNAKSSLYIYINYMICKHNFQ